MVGVVITTNPQAVNIPKGIPLTELVKIDKSKTQVLTNKERRAIHVKKNKIYNPAILKKQWDPIFFNQLTSKINKAKLMKFITAEPESFQQVF